MAAKPVQHSRNDARGSTFDDAITNIDGLIPLLPLRAFDWHGLVSQQLHADSPFPLAGGG